MKIQQRLASNLRVLRVLNNLTQRELATQLSVCRAVISAYERGISMPSIDILLKLSKIFGVSVDILLGTEKNSFPNNENLLDVSGLSKPQVEALKVLIKSLQ